MMYPTAWTFDEIATLHKLWADGKTALEVGAIMGKSRSAVCGKLQRIRSGGVSTERVKKLTSTRTAIPVAPLKVSKPKSPACINARADRVRALQALAYAPRVDAVPDYAITLDSPLATLWNRTGCAWPVNGGGPYLFCNAPSPDGPYCPHHQAKMVRAWT